ncbi:MAG: hypothetical protein JRM85_00430 [Nitrososphaerota archaeon]|nr:hypothetical protein [Nitrososphaerota archaeon]MDG6919393.1 hypothetical protein [Nitrososphaerota archaeon]
MAGETPSRLRTMAAISSFSAALLSALALSRNASGSGTRSLIIFGYLFLVASALLDAANYSSMTRHLTRNLEIPFKEHTKS